MRLGRLTRKAMILGLGRGAAVISQAALAIVLVRWWQKPEFGHFQQVRVIIGFAALLDLGLPTGLLQATAGLAAESRRALFRRGVLLALSVGGVAVVAGVIAGAATSSPISTALPFVGIIVAATISSAAVDAVFVVEDRHATSSAIAIASAGAGIVAAVFVLFVDPTVAAVYGALALAAVGRLVALLAVSGVLQRRDGEPTVGTLGLLRTSIAVSANRLLGVVSGSVDRAVVAIAFSASTLGWYAAGAWEIPFMTVFFGAIASTLVPELSEHHAAERTDDFLAVWRTATSRVARILFPFALWAWIWAPEIIRVLFTDAYGEAADVFRIYLVMLPLRAAVYAPVLVALDAKRPLVIGAAVDLALNVGLSFALIGPLGPVGPAVATAVATWVQVGYYLTATGKRLGASLGRLLPLGSLAKSAVFASLIALPTLAVRLVVASDVVRLGAAAVLAGAIGLATVGRRGLIER